MKTNFELIELLEKIGVSRQYAGDLLVLALYIIAGIVIVFLVKKKNLGAFVMSSYIAYTIFSFSYFIPKNISVGLGYFILLIMAVFYLMKRIVAFHLGGSELSIIFKSVLIAVLALGMNTSLILSWLPPENIKEFFTPFSENLFTSDVFRLCWMIIPFLTLAFIKKYRY
ncbi:MAG: hypothetical protein PHQ20_04140 [Candidatus Moranbacteria bacterium]|jgi:hypothetical protein|nr:hypothetical protein [Candidatus Moranbacteria bacterium]